MTDPRPGDEVFVVTADGQVLQRVAVTGCIDGRDFPVVRVVRPGVSETDWMPWPCEDVFLDRASAEERAGRG